MHPTIKKLFTNFRVILLLIFLVFAIVAIRPDPGAEGVAIRHVVLNSSAADAGIIGPKPTATPMSREVIVAMNNMPIKNVEDYEAIISTLQPNQTLTIETTKEYYRLQTRYAYDVTILDELEDVVVEEEREVTGEDGETFIEFVNVTKKVNKTLKTPIGMEPIGLSIYQAPTNNIRKGLDLEGGTRVLLQPEKQLSSENMSILLLNMQQRLNVYGLSDVVVREAGDLSGNQYILVEIAGANEEEVNSLLASQGKFEAKVGEKVVFSGGNDITYVCRSADCSGIDPRRGCGGQDQTWSCAFSFSIALSSEAAQRQADITKRIPLYVDENGQEYLEEQLVLYLDDQEVDRLNIGASLKGRAVTDISISGGGSGITEQAAQFNTLENMKRLQTILITGSLPVKLEIVQTDAISSALGNEFLKNALFVGLLALLGVASVCYIRYRRLQVAIPLMTTMASEIILMLGTAALIGWNIDLAAIAGIIIAVGTGVDDQIVIADEVLGRKGRKMFVSWKQRLAAAFGIIMVAYFTTLVAMFPLLFAGAGLLKGFALTTIIGITFGVFVTRPAFASIVEILLKDKVD